MLSLDVIRARVQKKLKCSVEFEVEDHCIVFYQIHSSRQVRIGFRLDYNTDSLDKLDRELDRLSVVRKDFRIDVDNFLLTNQRDIISICAKGVSIRLKEQDECSSCQDWILKRFDLYAFAEGTQRCNHNLCVSCWLTNTHCPVCGLSFFNK